MYLSAHPSAGYSRRRVLAALGQGAAVALFSACRSTGQSTAPGQPETAKAPLVRQATTIQVWMTDFNDETKRFYEEKLVPAMKQREPLMTMDIQWSGWDNFTTKLITAISGGVGPDVFQPGSDFVASLVLRGVVLQLDDYVKRWGQKADFYEAAWDSYWGKLYHVPYLSAVDTIAYRKDFFRDAGLDPERPPVTWEEFVQHGQKLTRREGDEWRVQGFARDTSVRTWRQLYWQAGGEEWNQEQTRVVFNNEAGIEALTFMKDWIDKYQISPRQPITGLPPGMNALTAGRAAMMRQNGSGAVNMKQRNPDAYQVYGVGLPLRHRRQFGEVDVDVLSISAASKNPDAAWLWIEHCMEPQNLLEYNLTIQFMPPRKSLAAQVDALDPVIAKFRAILERYGHPYRSDIGMSAIIQEQFNDFFADKKSARDALDQAVKGVNELLSQYQPPRM